MTLPEEIETMSEASEKSARERKQTLGTAATVSGAVAAAFAAAACCVGPLVVAVLGIGGAGAMVALAPYRPYFLGATVLMLGLGFFMVYRKRFVPVDGAACDCEGEAPKKKRDLAKVMLWVATVMVVVFSLSPYLIEATALASSDAVESPIAGASLVRVQIPVTGMDCASCGVAIQRAMDNVGTPYQDFALDLEEQSVSFRYEGDAEMAPQFASSIRDIGYEVGAAQVELGETR